jgi:hypothetical protein
MTRTEDYHSLTGHSFRKNLNVILIILVGLVVVLWLIFSVSISPFNVFGGAIWFKGGPHYISDAQIAGRTEQINVPAELKMEDTTTLLVSLRSLAML